MSSAYTHCYLKSAIQHHICKKNFFKSSTYFLVSIHIMHLKRFLCLTGDQGGNISASAWKPLPFKTKTWAQPSYWGQATAIQTRQPYVFLELVKWANCCPLKIIMSINSILLARTRPHWTVQDTAFQWQRCYPKLMCGNVNKFCSLSTCYGIKKI